MRIVGEGKGGRGSEEREGEREMWRKSMTKRRRKKGRERVVYTVQSYVPLFIHVCYFSKRVHFDIQVGDHAVDYAQVAAKEKLTELQLRVRQLLDQLEQIGREQAYQRVSRLRPFPFPSHTSAIVLI